MWINSGILSRLVQYGYEMTESTENETIGLANARATIRALRTERDDAGYRAARLEKHAAEAEAALVDMKAQKEFAWSAHDVQQSAKVEARAMAEQFRDDLWSAVRCKRPRLPWEGGA